MSTQDLQGGVAIAPVGRADRTVDARALGRPSFLHRHLSQLYVGTTVLLDVWLLTAAFLIAYWFYFLSGFVSQATVPPFSAYYLALPWVVFIWMIVAPSFNLHQYPKGFSWTGTIVHTVQAATMCGVVTMATTFLYRGFSYSRATMAIGWGLAIVLVSLERLLAWELLSTLRVSGHALTRTAILGLAGPGREIVRNMKQFVEMGYHLVGFIPDHPGEENALAEEGVACLGSLESVKDIVRRQSIELLVIAVPHSERAKILNVVSECDLEKVEIRFISDVLDMVTRPVGIEEVAGIPLLGLREHPLNTWRGSVKRAIDFVGALVGLAILSPLFLGIALLVKLTSKGPVFYKQTRVGRDDKPFEMYKFRTMRVDAEAETGPVWAQKNDSRYTAIGGFLRRTSLDELAQLLNVLKGEMSLVGPRPERPEFVEKLKEQVPKYLHRHKVKGGITGWAQVNGLRGRTSIEQRIEHDQYYITHWSLGLDFVILLRTVREVLRGDNAY